MIIQSQLEIDEHCQAYEQYRNEECCGPLSIRRFLSERGLADDPCPMLVSELTQIDVQLQWMAWHKGLPALIADENVDAVRKSFAQIPKLDDYAYLVPGQEGSIEREAFHAVAKCEMESRNSWADAIGPIHYLCKYNLQLLPDRDYIPNYVFCYLDGSVSHRESPMFELRGKTVIGRQRTADSKDLFCEELCHGNRIVIASRLETKISREQLQIELLNRQYAIVTNLSTVNPVIMVSVGLLQPQQSRIMRFPFGIRLPQRRLSFTISH